MPSERGTLRKSLPRAVCPPGNVRNSCVSGIGVRDAIDEAGFQGPRANEVHVSPAAAFPVHSDEGLVFKLSSSQASPGEFYKC